MATSVALGADGRAEDDQVLGDTWAGCQSVGKFRVVMRLCRPGIALAINLVRDGQPKDKVPTRAQCEED